MRVEEKVPQIRNLHTPLRVTWIVLGPGHGHLAGTIKTIKYDVHVSTPFFKVECDTEGPRPKVIKALNLKTDYQDTGCRFLREMYEVEGALDDYEVWVQHQAAIEAGRPVDPFPNDRLPKALLAMRAGRSTLNKFTIPPKGEKAVAVEPEPESKKSKGGRPKKSVEATEAELAALLDGDDEQV